jgi:hypothetical protein
MYDEIVKLKTEIDLFQLVSPHTGGLIKSGSAGFMKGYCPFCQQDRARHKRNFRFWVHPNGLVCGCHKCSKGEKPWDAINFYALLHNVTLRRAIEELSK